MCFCVAKFVLNDAIVVQNDAKLLPSDAIVVQNDTILRLFAPFGFAGNRSGVLGVEIEEVVAGLADLFVVEGFFAEERQARYGLRSVAGQLHTGLEVVVVDVHLEVFEEERLGEPAVECAAADAEVVEGLADGLAGDEDIDEKPCLLL